MNSEERRKNEMAYKKIIGRTGLQNDKENFEIHTINQNKNTVTALRTH